MIWIELIYNLSLLVALSVVSGFVDARWDRDTRKGQLLQGVVFGAAAMVGMLRAFVFASGVVFDGRSVMVSLGALFFGPLTATVMCALTIPLRLLQGGIGTMTGIVVILVSAAIGVGAYRRRSSASSPLPAAGLWLFGLLVHAAMLAAMLTLPTGTSMDVLRRMTLPVIVVYPLATVLVGKVLSDQAIRRSALTTLCESEERFHSFFTNLPAGSCLDELVYENGRAVDYRILDVNPAYERIMGIPREKAVGALGSQVYGEGEAPFLEKLERVAATGEPKQFEAFFAPVGKYLDFTVSRPAPGMISAVFFDITEQRRQEESLRRIEWMLTPGHAVPEPQTPPVYGDLTGLNTVRTILDAIGKETLEDIVRDYLDLLDTSAAVYERNGDYACGIFASGWCRLMDDASRHLCGTNDNAVALGSGKWHCHESCWNEASSVAMDTGDPTDIACAGGIRLYAVPIKAGGRVVGAMNFGYGDPPRDPEVLRELARKYGLDPAELSREAGAYETRPPYIIEMAKRRIEVSARLIGEMVERAAAETRIEHLNRVLRSIRDVNQLIVREKDQGRLIHTACDILVRESSYTAALILLTDGQGHVTDYVQAGMDAVFAPLAVWLDEGRMPLCCQAADGAEGGVYVVSDPQTVCSACPIAEHCPGTNVMCTHLAHGNQTFGYLAVAADPAQALDDAETGLIREVAEDLGYALHTMAIHGARKDAETARDAAQKALLQAQKMESVGRLAGGVAHDFNNLLMGIMGYAELCQGDLPAEHPARKWLDEIMREAQRSANLTRQLLAFARKQTVAPKLIDLNDAVAHMLKMLRRLIGEDIDLAWQPGAELGSVKIDPSQVDQILANLCVNARDAIDSTGKVTIETGNVSIDGDYCEEHVEATPGSYVMLAVSDDGCGMDHETLANVFEPFFTTKPTGEGTGLGLATIYGIVKQNNGFLNVYSEPGKGTTFRIYLPRDTSVSKAAPEAATKTASQGGSETILLVEDEKAIRFTIRVFLERFGYTVIAAGSPAEALQRVAEQSGPIDLLLTDVVMPGMSGRDLAEKLAVDFPSMKILYMSGYTADVIAHRGILEDGVQFISKPISRDALAQKVREVLG